MAGLMWAIMDWFFHKRPTILGIITGAVAGLVAITPADLGLPSVVAQRAEDGVKVYFGERDDMTALLTDARSCV